MPKDIHASIIVFVKYPVEGKVKTRLAAKIGSFCAKEIYRIVSSNVIRDIKKVERVNLYFFYSDDEDKVKNWIGNEFIYFRQTGKALGEKMKNAFKKVFDLGSEKVLIIGTDIPGLNSKIINEAIIRLNKTDFVIGPSFDGGYYLLGMKNFYPTVFSEIEFSTDKVFEKTLDKIKNLNLKYSTLKILRDIDTKEDLNDWLNKSPESEMIKEIKKFYTPERA